MVILALFVVLIGFDQATKVVARDLLSGKSIVHVVDDVFILVYVENNGAFLSLGAHWPPAVRNVVFLALSAVLVVLVLAYTIFSRNLSRAATVGLTLIAAGGVGNVIDRFLYHGKVADFMNVGLGNLRTGVFNFADFYIMVGLVLVLVSGFVSRRQDR